MNEAETILDKAYDENKAAVIERCKDWAIYYRHRNDIEPSTSSNSILGKMYAESVTQKRMAKEGRLTDTVIYKCEQCQKEHFHKRPKKCERCDSRKLKRIVDGLAGKRCSASLIHGTGGIDAEFEEEHKTHTAILTMPVKIQKVAIANYVWWQSQEDSAKALGITRTTFQNYLSLLHHFLMGAFYR